jgi:hypothetical protein
MSPPKSAFRDVPYPPPPPHVEQLPGRPSEAAVWVDGSWEWSGTRWRWQDGGWYERPGRDVYYSEWALARHGGTRLLYAGAAWRDAKGDAIPEPRKLASASAIGVPPGIPTASDAGESGEPDANP